MTLINVRKNAFFVGLTLLNDRANLRYVICCRALISCNKVGGLGNVILVAIIVVVIRSVIKCQSLRHVDSILAQKVRVQGYYTSPPPPIKYLDKQTLKHCHMSTKIAQILTFFDIGRHVSTKVDSYQRKSSSTKKC